MKNSALENMKMKKQVKHMPYGIIKIHFTYLNSNSFDLVYESMVRSHLDYCSSVWAPYKKVILRC